MIVRVQGTGYEPVLCTHITMRVHRWGRGTGLCTRTDLA